MSDALRATDAAGAATTPRVAPLTHNERVNAAPRWVFPAVVALVLLPRLLVFGVNENLYGDAVARTDLAERWAQAPHWFTSFKDGAQQYGPLHIAMIGAALLVDPDPLRAGRWVSLLFGALTAIPLFALTRQLFGWRAGVWACLALSVWGLHIQCSTTAASEAVTLFFLLAACAFAQRAREPGELAALVWAAVCMNIAAALRYDPWLLMPILGATFLFGAEDRAAGVTRFVLFGLLCVPFPLIWIHGNELAHGDPLFPIRFTEAYHQAWRIEELAALGEASFRLRGIWFWPGVALFTLTPLIALLGLTGMVSAYRRVPQSRWLLWLTLAPTAYYSFRIAVLADFVPLARFAVPQVALLLPFVHHGARVVGASWNLGARRILTASVLVGWVWTAWLGALTFDPVGPWEWTFAPVSPISRNPPELTALAKRLEAERGSDRVVFDADPGYWEIQLAALARVPEPARVPVRWDSFPDEYARGPVGWIVASPEGALGHRPGWAVTAEQITAADGAVFDRVPQASERLWLYRRR